MLFTSHNAPRITLGNEHCLKLLLGVCNTKKRADLSISLCESHLGKMISLMIGFHHIIVEQFFFFLLTPAFLLNVSIKNVLVEAESHARD